MSPDDLSTLERSLAAMRGYTAEALVPVPQALLARVIEAALAKAAPGSGVAEGWQIVPVEPTPEMNGAGDLAISHQDMEICLRDGRGIPIAACYRAMLAASPAPPQGETR